MRKGDESPLLCYQASPRITPWRQNRPLRDWALLTGLVLTCFARPLFDLIRYALSSELFSYVLLVPFISLYLAWQKRANLRSVAKPNRKWSLVAFCAAGAVSLGYGVSRIFDLASSQSDYLAWTILSFYLCLVGVSLWCLGADTLRAVAFPLGFLAFVVPFPNWLTGLMESFLQHTSALTAHYLFVFSGTPVFRQDLVFQLPGMRLEVAPECSGIHSTLVLLITSLLAGQYFLRNGWLRGTLAMAVIPLGVLRNGARVWIIGQLCIHLGPQMINSPLHRRGGPLFFVATLPLLFLLVCYLRKLESKKDVAGAVQKAA